MAIPALVPIKSWSPFKINALGLITLLGADSIRKTLGQLVHSPWEYFPLLAGHIFADNSIADPIPGFVLYDITDGIKATDLNVWFTRWLSCQELTSCQTVLKISIRDSEKEKNHPPSTYIMAGVAIVLNTVLIEVPALIGDWYGFAASVSLVTLVAARLHILTTLRNSLGVLAAKAGNETKTKRVKLLITLLTGSCVSVHTTIGITLDCLLTEARPDSRKYHQAARGVCWVAFGVHAVSLGMACLAIEPILVALTLAFSVAAARDWTREGRETKEAGVGSRIIIRQHVLKTTGKRAETCASLDLSKDEKRSLIDWFIMPRPSNKIWWENYAAYEATMKNNPGNLGPWGELLQGAHEAYALQPLLGSN
ncbi:hypothetical protein CC86DRAFT_403023 [Ophiobolus disseminans]|uniref:Uncharacterized protein n=1 Tax=Ophiobolus disseminans TaxID=1469910 RepID=A0A6A7AAI4_9PLEO|nr:hypothetical protein CC86DRAFT_403023 [Ophiobolus disseminans]